MKKLILIILLLTVTGCSVVRIDTKDLGNTISVVLSKDNKLYNQIGKGYKYYIPRGVSYMDTNSYNEVLYASGNYYYLYIDTISYYHKVSRDYKENKEAYYSKTIDLNNKKGYIEINKQKDNNYFVEFMYNYAKIETVVTLKDIEEVILNASYMLSTIKFNDNVIKLMLDDEFLSLDEQYDIFTSKQETSDFLKLEEEVK
ncbi:MAG: hypothetical protein RSB71_02955 [Bacilli bacterium]